MRKTERFEYKYALDYNTYLAFKNKLSMFMTQDKYTLIANQKRYFVRSLYYDTYDFKHCAESEDGQFGRIKCRIRTYSHTHNEADIISIEIKTKLGAIVKKYSQLIPVEEFNYFNKNGYFSQSSKVLDEFTRLMWIQQLEPKAIVEYDREGYETIDGSDLRLTFDFGVRSGESDKLFKDRIIHTRSHNNAIICEIKCGMRKPDWLEKLIKEYGLRVVGNSKYVQAIDRIYPSTIFSKVFST
jgi:hypothetical protein